MHTPDEIKKGLECCSNVNFVCNEECPYYKSLSEGEDCCLKKNADALALIQQLQDDNAQLNRCIENMTDKLNAMNDEVAKLQAERDAAVADLEHVKDCDSCKYDNACFTGKKDCFGCHEKRCPCLTCQYEWRGVTKEE